MPVPSEEENIAEVFEVAVSGQMPTGDGRFVKISERTAQEIRAAAPEMNGQK